MLTDETINLNYTRYIERLKKYELLTDYFIEGYGEKLKDATFAMQDSSGAAYKGSLLDVILNKLCVLGVHLNDSFEHHPMLQVNMNSLLRVLLIQHISKAELFIPQTQVWRAKNGYFYEFNNELPTSLKCGERSIYICNKYGISLSEEEYEAVRIIDTEEKESYGFTNPLCYIVRAVNKLVSIELCRAYKRKSLTINNNIEN